MYTLKMTNTETLEITENYYYTFDTITTIFEDRVNTLLSFYVETYELELLDEDGICLAYANGKQEYGGLLWKLDEEDEDFGDWDWTLLEEWAENGISAPTYDDEDEWYEEDDWASNYPCDTYGMCAGTSCPNYWKCNG